MSADPDGSHSGAAARARAHVEQTRARAEEAFHRLEQARARNAVVDVGFQLYDRDTTAGGQVLAGALAFRLFVFVVPYVFVAVTILGTTANLQNKSAGDIARDTGLTGVIAESVADARRQSDGVQIASLVIGSYALFLAARGVVKTTRAVHALAWRVRPPRLKHSWRPTLLVIGLTAATGVLAQLGNDFRGEDLFKTVLVNLITFLLWGGTWLWLSWLLPHDRRAPWTALLPGAMLIGTVTTLMHLVTVVYFSRKVSSASDTYGALGAAVGILLALYLIGRAIAASAVLNATVWERGQMRERADASPEPASG